MAQMSYVSDRTHFSTTKSIQSNQYSMVMMKGDRTPSFFENWA
ncbi:MAG: hypothetical protein AAF171_04980 [Cyanobacteria bacterium P01_A01_bin.116]